jgi:hypothetical protein
MAFLAAIPAWVSVAAAAVSAVGTIASSQAQARQMEQNAKIADNNAMMLTAQATEQERRQRADLAALKARNRVGVAKSGVTMEGTPLLVAEDITGQGELDALTIRYNGLMKSNAQKYEAASLRSQASNTRTSGFLSAAGTLLGGAAGYANTAGAVAGTSSGVSLGTGITTGGTNLSYMNGGSGIRI